MTQLSPERSIKRFQVLVKIFLVGMVVLHGNFAWKVRDGLRKGYQDFTIFYGAGKMLNLGSGNHLYDDQAQYRVQQSFAPWVSIRKDALPYNHPPFEALLFMPFARLPYFAAYLCWDFLNLAILAALPLFLRPHIAILQKIPVLWYLCACLAFFPVCITLVQGQDAILLLALFALAYVALKRNNDFFAGCVLGLGLFRFHQVLPVMAVLLVGRRMKAAFGFGLVGAVLVLVSLLLVGPHELLAYPRYLWAVENVLESGPIVPLDMPTLRGLLHGALSSYLSPLALKAIVAVGSLAILGFVVAKWKSNRGRAYLDLSYALCLTAAVLVSYHAYVYELSTLFLAILLVVNHRFSYGSYDRWRAIKLYGPVFLLFFSPLQMVLCLRYVRFYLFALVLLLWIWGIAGEIERVKPGQDLLLDTNTEFTKSH